MPAVLAPLRIACCSLAVAVCCAAISAAGEFNPTLNIGDAAPAWEKLPGVDGKEHALADLDPKLPIVVVFICNSCDVAADYEDRIIAFSEKHKGEATVVAISASNKPADALPRLRERADAKKFPFTYLHDKSQQVGQAYGANYTPEFFLLSPGKPDGRRIVYMGAMDDSTYADQVKTNYLEPALAALQAGDEPTIKETAPRGCRIKYPRKRE
jgi:peroxiredoxin